MAKLKSIDQLAGVTAREAQSQMAMMQRDIRALRDSLSGLTGGIKAPVIKPPRTRIKGSRTGIDPILSAAADVLGRAVGKDLASDAGYGNGASSSSFYQSEGQIAGNTLAQVITGQRVR